MEKKINIENMTDDEVLNFETGKIISKNLRKFKEAIRDGAIVYKRVLYYPKNIPKHILDEIESNNDDNKALTKFFSTKFITFLNKSNIYGINIDIDCKYIISVHKTNGIWDSKIYNYVDIPNSLIKIAKYGDNTIIRINPEKEKNKEIYTINPVKTSIVEEKEIGTLENKDVNEYLNLVK
jgi:hypothetical protein